MGPIGIFDSGIGGLTVARAAFDYLHLNVLYDKNAPVVARSGPACLSAGVGDCDEQTNAFFSLLRTKMILNLYKKYTIGFHSERTIGSAHR
mgnify:CR=1 FL=1